MALKTVTPWGAGGCLGPKVHEIESQATYVMYEDTNSLCARHASFARHYFILSSVRSIGGYSSVITALTEKAMSRAFGFGLGTSIFLIPTLFLARQQRAFAAERRSTPNIAVIGAGIGGSSSSHFLRELYGSEATIDVFEASDRIGGRLDTIEIAGRIFESGGSIIHPDNKYMGDFVKLLGKFVVRHLAIVSYILSL